MLIVMSAAADESDIQRVCDTIERLGFEARPIPGGQRTAIGVVGNDGPVDAGRFVGLPNVREVISVSAPYKLVSWEWKPTPTIIELPNGTLVGGGGLALMAGPCAVESRDQIFRSAELVAHAGGTVLRGGVFKPRTSPYSFQGLGLDGLRWMREAADAHGLAVVTEAVDPDSARAIADLADIIQIGARNMQNFALLTAVGELRVPVMLKRGMAATIKEWLLAAEYVLRGGNEQVILCERGIRSFDDMTRNVLDIGAIAAARTRTHLPIVADPSHGCGRRDLVAPLARAATAAGADGLIIEMHPDPSEALSDGAQSLYPAQLDALAIQLKRLREAMLD
ncbi:MAG: 3-deoxy-7-phosphoheptulonate synthase [Myxococcales bacterium]|nr:3-deoxy-7-phosphoheptulonate synthase [Myxococcales bacterium]MCB9531576.1 3-deoxy-7-phosphoheptulonate synthase [Myxococcales bacterium]MCB9532773.1 3-deoxy-7-phosphoheptulonate synthase [Myxococcales bacterium]